MAPYFALQNSHGHVKVFLRYLLTLWSRVLKIFASPALGCILVALNIGMLYKSAYVWPHTRLWHSNAINLEG
jgi:hypothetical protein